MNGMHFCGQTAMSHKAVPPGNMDDMTLGQILTNALVIKSDKKEPIIAAAQPVKAYQQTNPTSTSLSPNSFKEMLPVIKV